MFGYERVDFLPTCCCPALRVWAACEERAGVLSPLHCVQSAHARSSAAARALYTQCAAHRTAVPARCAAPGPHTLAPTLSPLRPPALSSGRLAAQPASKLASSWRQAEPTGIHTHTGSTCSSADRRGPADRRRPNANGREEARLCHSLN